MELNSNRFEIVSQLSCSRFRAGLLLTTRELQYAKLKKTRQKKIEVLLSGSSRLIHKKYKKNFSQQTALSNSNRHQSAGRAVNGHGVRVTSTLPRSTGTIKIPLRATPALARISPDVPATKTLSPEFNAPACEFFMADGD